MLYEPVDVGILEQWISDDMINVTNIMNNNDIMLC